MDTPIVDMLSSLNLGTRFNMPGHKGRLELFGSRIAKYDVTELPETDNLLSPTGVIARSQRLFAEETGAAHCLYSVNGSSAGVLAAILYAAGDGGKLIMARDCHISAVSALRLSGASPVYVGIDSALGAMPAPVDADAVCAAIYREPFAKAVFVTYPNYYGLCTDLEKIACAAHKCHIPLIVDAAHAAHFPYSELLPPSPAALGADIWITSAHKTLPAYGQTAAVFCGASVDAARLKRCLNLVQTTSPSYLLLASLDYARAYMAEKGAAAIDHLHRRTCDAVARIAEIDGLRVEATDDFTRMVIDVSARGITGFRAANVLAQNGVVVECADERRIVLILTVCDMQGDLEALVYALKLLPKGSIILNEYAYTLSAETELSPREAAALPAREARLKDAEGRLCARAVFAYPPGVPLIIEGQRITDAHIAAIEEFGTRSYTLPAFDGRVLVAEE